MERNVDKTKQYKLYGTMDIFNIPTPLFIYPIFECDGKYYFKNSDNFL